MYYKLVVSLADSEQCWLTDTKASHIIYTDNLAENISSLIVSVAPADDQAP